MHSATIFCPNILSLASLVSLQWRAVLCVLVIFTLLVQQALLVSMVVRRKHYITLHRSRLWDIG